MNALIVTKILLHGRYLQNSLLSMGQGSFFTESWLSISKVDAHFDFWRYNSIQSDFQICPYLINWNFLAIYKLHTVCMQWLRNFETGPAIKNGHQHCCCCCTRPILFFEVNVHLKMRCRWSISIFYAVSRHASFLVLSVYNNTRQTQTVARAL